MKRDKNPILSFRLGAKESERFLKDAELLGLTPSQYAKRLLLRHLADRQKRRRHRHKLEVLVEQKLAGLDAFTQAVQQLDSRIEGLQKYMKDNIEFTTDSDGHDPANHH